MKRKLITALDIFIIAALLAVCVFSFFIFNGSDLGTTAVITLENNELYRLSLTQNTEKLIKTDYGYNKVVVENGYCFVKSADCRDAICINRGKINKVGESIVCLPHKLIVEIR